MASSTSPSASFHLPFDVVKKSNGFAIDIGGSVAKVVYRDKEDWDAEKNEPRKIEGNLARVRTTMFRRENLSEVINFINNHCHINRSVGKEVLIHSTGIGGHEFKKEIEEKIGVKLHNLTEFDCFVKSFRYLVTYTPESKLLHEIAPETLKHTKTRIDMMLGMVEKMKDMKWTESKMEMMDPKKIDGAKEYVQKVQKQEDSKPYAERDDMFPCLLGMLGSGIAFMKIEADGTFSTIDGSNRGGRFFLGLGSILTGAKTYEELMELAESGDGSKVDIYGRDFKVHEGDEDMYGSVQPDQLIFCFGKGVNAKIDDFKKSDLARSLLHLLCLDIAQTADLILKTSNVKRVYLSGGFGNRPVVRDILTNEFIQRAFMVGMLGEREMLFIKNGCHLGALGCFLEGCI